MLIIILLSFRENLALGSEVPLPPPHFFPLNDNRSIMLHTYVVYKEGAKCSAVPQKINRLKKTSFQFVISSSISLVIIL